eukprot:scaffold104557_cov68-Phaeocystis_antarctica.AAC.3
MFFAILHLHRATITVQDYIRLPRTRKARRQGAAVDELSGDLVRLVQRDTTRLQTFLQLPRSRPVSAPDDALPRFGVRLVVAHHQPAVGQGLPGPAVPLVRHVLSIVHLTCGDGLLALPVPLARSPLPLIHAAVGVHHGPSPLLLALGIAPPLAEQLTLCCELEAI